MLRAGPVLPIVPKPVFEGGPPGMHKPLVSFEHEPQLTSGFLKFARLKALNISAWNRNLTFSVIENCLRMEKSQSCKLGPVTIPTPLVPRRVSGAVANAAGLIQPSGPGLANSTGPPR